MGGFHFGIKRPKFHGPSFGGSGKEDVEVDTPSANIDETGKIDISSGIDVNTPELSGEFDTPAVDIKAGGDVELPDANLNVDGPNLNVKEDVQLPEGSVSGDININPPDVSGGIDFGIDGRRGSHSSGDGDEKEKKKKSKKHKGGFSFKLPKFHGPNFGGSRKGDIHVETPEENINGTTNVAISGEIDPNTPDFKAQLDAPEDVKTGAEVELPGASVKTATRNLDVEGDGKLSGDISGDINLTTPDLSGGIGIGGRRGSHSSEEGDDKEKKEKKSKSGFGFGLKMPKFHGPSFGGSGKGEVHV